MFSTCFQLLIEVENDKYNSKMCFCNYNIFLAITYPKIWQQVENILHYSWKQPTCVNTMDTDHFNCKPTHHYNWRSFSIVVHVWMNFICWHCMASSTYHYSWRFLSILDGIHLLILHDIIKHIVLNLIVLQFNWAKGQSIIKWHVAHPCP